MYDELVKSLRICGSWNGSVRFAGQDGCAGCLYNDEENNCKSWDYDAKKENILLDAADAIEELSKRLDESIPKGDAEIIISEVAKPRWIPATERLPEEYTEVLCYYEYFRYGDYNCMFRAIDRGYFSDGRWGGEAGQGHKNKVLAWMPLPEPPKEET